jgi:hypothetical protein
MNTMRSIPKMIDGLRALSDHLCGLDSASLEGELLNDAANFIEGASNSLREHMALLIEMRVKLEQVRPLMQEAASSLSEYIMHEHRYWDSAEEKRRFDRDMELPNAMRALLRWWEPGTKEPVSISHWGIVE